MPNKIIYKFVLCALAMFWLPFLASASETVGTIDDTNKYAWGENIGWINFGTSHGNVQVIDSGLSGYALAENIGWIYLGNVTNDGQGNLTGYAWSENAGWIKFDPTNGGVVINSAGEFTGSALGETIGWIIFDGGHSVKTDWRPRSARPQCNNSLDDDSDGKIDYPVDQGCESLTDNKEQDEGGAIMPAASYSPPAPPTGGFKVVIVEGAEYTNNPVVQLKLSGGADTVKMAVSNSTDFRDGGQENYQTTKEWRLTPSDGIKIVYVKFYNDYGQPAPIVSDQIILDTVAPKLVITKIKEQYLTTENVVLSGQTEPGTEVVLHWSDKYGLVFATASGRVNFNLGQLSAGMHRLEFKLKDLAGNGRNVYVDIKVSGPAPELVTKPTVPAPATPLVIAPEIVPKPTTPATGPAAPEAPVSGPGAVEEEVTETGPAPRAPVEPAPAEPAIIAPAAPAAEDNEEQSPPVEPVPEMIIIPEQAPPAMHGDWVLLSRESIRNFVLAPLPREIRELAHKFPKLEETLNQVGITKVTDVDKLKTVKLTLPGLTERAGLSGANFVPGHLAALPKGIPVADLPLSAKQALPSEIVFAKTGGELIDFNITLQVNDQGEPRQKIATISGKPLQLAVKPEKPVARVKGYLVFRRKTPQVTALQMKLEQFTASLFFVSPAFAQNQEKPVRQEERLVLLEFDYTDPDGDGIYTAEIQAPIVEGEYEIITVMDYADPESGSKEIRMITVVDPEGYVYEQTGGKETRIPGAIVSIYWFNPTVKQYELWPAAEFQQENPQITDTTGKYSFLVPEGSYYLKVEAPGYPDYIGKSFQVKEGSGVHFNIALRSKYWYLKIVDMRTLLLVLVVLLLVYNFYRDKIREKLFKKQI